MTFGERLRTLRAQRGLSVRGLADAAELSPSTVSRYERGDRDEPSGTHLQALASALHTTVGFLLTGADQVTERDARYASLATVLEQFPRRWSPGAIAQVQSYALDGDDPGEEFWVRRLDAITMAVKVAEQSFDLGELDAEVKRRRGA